MKKMLVLTLALTLASGASAQIFFEGTLDQALSEAKTANKRLLIDFSSYT